MELGSAAVRLPRRARPRWSGAAGWTRPDWRCCPSRFPRPGDAGARSCCTTASRTGNAPRPPATPTRSSTRSSCGRRRPSPPGCGPAGGGHRGRPGRAGAAGRRRGVRRGGLGRPRCGCCAGCASESRMPSDEGEGVHLDPHDHSEPGHPGPLGHRTDGQLWVPERECGVAAPASAGPGAAGRVGRGQSGLAGLARSGRGLLTGRRTLYQQHLSPVLRGRRTSVMAQQDTDRSTRACSPSTTRATSSTRRTARSARRPGGSAAPRGRSRSSATRCCTRVQGRHRVR